MADDCRPEQITVDGHAEVIRVHGAEPLSAVGRDALGEVVAAFRRHVDASDPNLGVRQELIMACLAATRCIPDGTVQATFGTADGTRVKARLKATVRAALIALTPASSKEGGHDA